MLIDRGASPVSWRAWSSGQGILRWPASISGPGATGTLYAGTYRNGVFKSAMRSPVTPELTMRAPAGEVSQDTAVGAPLVREAMLTARKVFAEFKG